MSQTILVTGCCGYIGSVLTPKLLAAHHRVIGVDNLMYNQQAVLLPWLPHKNFEFHRLDIRNLAEHKPLLQRADTVIHLAALVGEPICKKDPESAVDINQWGTEDLVNLLSKQQRILYANTNSGYGQTDGESEVTEEDPLNPCSVYGQTKCSGEVSVLKHPRSLVFRLATVFGASPRMRLDLMVNYFTNKLYELREKKISDVIDGVASNDEFSIYEPHFKRNFVGVQDVTRAFLLALERPNLAGVYNLGLPSANMSKLELAHLVCDTLQVSRRVVTVGEGKDVDQRNYIVSTAKFTKATLFNFFQEVDDGIREVEQVCRLYTRFDRVRMGNTW